MRELWQARHLVHQIVWRDLTVRYRKTWLGWLWALINPALNMTLYYCVFGIMVRFQSPEYRAPYALVLLCGLVVWMLFSAALNATSECLLNNLHLIKKIWFPRTALAVAACGISLVDFILTLLCLGLLLPLVGISWSPLQLPLLLLCGLMTALCGWGAGCVLAVLRLRYRDVRHLMPLLIQSMFYATPVVWTPGILPARWQWLASVNPLAALTTLFRHALINGAVPSPNALLAAGVSSLAVAAAGYAYFIRNEPEATERA
ncbi:ABC transporter permease [Pantoea sp. Lu_F5_004]|uniref:ABC transporter permease n=1 Tax=Pantoea sp. Lu_F5_004 TaxID=3443507 RepID=UPI003EB782EA